MFRHILGNSEDIEFVKRVWEEFTGEQMKHFSIITTTLSEIAKYKNYEAFSSSSIGRKVLNGRKEGKLVWIEPDIDLDTLTYLVHNLVVANTIYISKDNGSFCGKKFPPRASLLTPDMISTISAKLLMDCAEDGESLVIGRLGAGRHLTPEEADEIKDRYQLVILDPESEYKKLVETLGGQHISVTHNPESKINPLALE